MFVSPLTLMLIILYQRHLLLRFLKNHSVTVNINRACLMLLSCDNFPGKFLLPGATAAALLMLGVLHAKRMYDDKKVSRAHALMRAHC
jgi:phosphatidylserine decarboxylase